MRNILLTIIRIIRNFLAVVGTITVIYIGFLVLQDDTPILWLVKTKLIGLFDPIAEKLDENLSTVPSIQYEQFKFIGEIRKEHPRILYPSDAAYEKLRARYAEDEQFKKIVDRQANKDGLFFNVVAWACKGDREAGRQVIDKLIKERLKKPTDSGKYDDAFYMALAYDLIGNLPDWSQSSRYRVETELVEFIRNGLNVLQGRSASMWHARTALASAVWVAAVSLDGPFDELRELQRLAQAHFLETVKAAELSEGWPEGYNYWINGRAFLLGMGCAAQMNLKEAPELNARARKLVERMGLWTIHGTEPIGRFHLFGDTGPRNDLKDETQRVIDLFAHLTGSQALIDYSQYLQGLHGKAAYYWPYRWGIPLLRGLNEEEHQLNADLPDLSVFNGRLPTSDIFGRDSLGQVFMRSDWGPGATFISFQSGDSLAHHGHYQAGHFTITKNSPLAITSGTYGKYFKEHRLNYYIRTVAANSLLILKPGEKVRPNRFFEENVAGGGQRIVMPTGSAVLSVKDWRANLHSGRHYEGGNIVAFENSDPRFVYIGSDLTDAYNNTGYDENGKGGKVSRVMRQLVYLRKDDVLIVYDRVDAVDAGFQKKWLLHSWGRPETADEHVLVGDRDNGIMESADAVARIQSGQGRLDVIRLLPDDAVMRKVGGPDYRYYVEMDGDDSDLDGRNMVEGAREEPWFDAGLWRLEIQPPRVRKADRFLVALAPYKAGMNRPRSISYLPVKGADGVVTPSAVVLFCGDEVDVDSFRYQLKDDSERLHIVIGTPGWKGARVGQGHGVSHRQNFNEGVLTFECCAGADQPVSIHIDRSP